MEVRKDGRRPLKSRKVKLFHRLASWLNKLGVTPNAISIMSVFFAIGAGAGMAATSLTWVTQGRWLWLVAAAFIQLRLLCNLLDGLVAVECNRKTANGDMFNEIPDRVADVAILVGAGYALGGCPVLGYVAALMAIFIAYIRALGASLAGIQVFHGPMAKPQRMFILTVVCLTSWVAPSALHVTLAGNRFGPMAFALAIVVLGGLATVIRRCRAISQTLNGAR